MNYAPRKRNTFQRYDSVMHFAHGPGTVMEEWGAFYSCRACYAELTCQIVASDTRCRVAKAVKCTSCSKPTLPFQVNGKGVFDVKFADGVKSVSGRWLK